MVLKPSAHRDIRVASVSETLARYLPEVHKKADLVIVLSHLGIEGDRDLAEEVRGIHLIIGGHSGVVSRDPLHVGETLIVRTGPGGEYVGRVLHRQPARLRSLDEPEVKEDVLRHLISMKRGEIGRAFDALLSDLRRQYADRIILYEENVARIGGTKAADNE